MAGVVGLTGAGRYELRPIDIKLRMDEIMRLESSCREEVASKQCFVLAVVTWHDSRASGSVVRRHFLTCIRCKTGTSHLIFP